MGMEDAYIIRQNCPYFGDMIFSRPEFHAQLFLHQARDRGGLQQPGDVRVSSYKTGLYVSATTPLSSS
jgi:hypothetical protein